MGGALPGPWAAWEYVGSTSLLASGSTKVEAKFPAGIRSGDLVVTIMSPLNETIRTTMSAAGWQHWLRVTRITCALPSMLLIYLRQPIRARLQTRYLSPSWYSGLLDGPL